MNISVFGAGYVGLASGACLAEVGYHVVCMDIDHVKIAKLKNGISAIWELGVVIVDKAPQCLLAPPIRCSPGRQSCHKFIYPVTV